MVLNQRYYYVLTLLNSLLISGFLLWSALPTISHAEITLDGSLGSAGPLAGPDYIISPDFGQLRGGNLFHSFGKFNVLTAESATFTGPNTVENIISRVTGGSQSYIDGLIRSTIPDANLFLLNPSGVLFGPNATLDVNGSFHVSTADFIRLEDGGIFYANLSNESVLTVAPPSAFGFLSNNPAGISIQESILEVPEGKTLSVIGGDIDIVGGPKGYLAAPSGRINIASVASSGEVIPNAPCEAPNLDVKSFERLGDITMSKGAYISVEGNGGGTVFIRGGRLTINSTVGYLSGIYATTQGDVNGADVGIDIHLTDELIMPAGKIASSSRGAGHAGDIRIMAGSVEIGGDPDSYASTNISSQAFASGDAGNVEIATGSLQIIDGAKINSRTLGPGKGGNLEVIADRVYMSGSSNPDVFTGIFANTCSSGSGGNLHLTSHSLEMVNRASIQAGTLSTGDAGNITISTGSLELKDASFISTSGFYGSGNAGNVEVVADRVLISGLESLTGPFGASATGIFTEAREGHAGYVRIATDSLILTNRGSISSISFGSGKAGNIEINEINAGSMEVLNGSNILSSAFGSGDGGNIEVKSDNVLISGVNNEPSVDITGKKSISPSGIASQAGLKGGKAGHVRITADNLQVLDGGRISTETFGPGDGGDIMVQANSVLISGVNKELRDFLTEHGRDSRGNRIDEVRAGRLASAALSTGTNSFFLGDKATGSAGNLQIKAQNLQIQDGGLISSETETPGNGGNIELIADRVELSDRATVSAESSGAGYAGSISIKAADTLFMKNSSVTTEAKYTDGGDIHVNAQYMVHLIDSEITASVGGGAKTVGGNINIDPEFVILDDSKIIANAFEGKGGNIRIVSGVFLSDPNSLVDASSALGIDGMVDIRAPITNISGSLVPLQKTFLSAAELLREPCEARIRGGKYSSFVIRGRDGLPLEPGCFLPSPLYLEGEGGY